ncbi:MAG: cadherin-like domain-containing protein [Pseudomonadales bacterium]|nr:cadherin-like domain-containing protein [Pseudomonadales bacterium]
MYQLTNSLMCRATRLALMLLFSVLGFAVYALPPTVVSPIPAVAVNEDNTDYVIDLNTVFLDPEAGALTFGVSSNSNPALIGISIGANAPGEMILSFAPGDSGSANIVLKAVDPELLEVTHSFNVVVSAVDDIPVAVDDVMEVEEDASIVLNVFDNDTMGDAPNVVTVYGVTHIIDAISFPNSSESIPTTQLNILGLPETLPNGTLSISGSDITYTPKPNYHGADFFSYTFTDNNGDIATAVVNVTVNAVNDAPAIFSVPTYTIPQATFLNISSGSGLLQAALDPDGDSLTVIPLGAALSSTILEDGALKYPGTQLTVNADGSFTYTPDVTFVGSDSFDVQFFDGNAVSNTMTVLVTVVAASPPATPAPPGEVQNILDLADVPLEDAISAETNVLVVMDDSGSMDWSIMSDQTSGLFYYNNSAQKDANVAAYNLYATNLFDLSTNTYKWWDGSQYRSFVAAYEDELGEDSVFNGNQYGAWRARSPQYSTIYYNREVRYEPWIGLDRNGTEFADAPPAAAPMDAFDPVIQTFDLTVQHDFYSYAIPVINTVTAGYRFVWHDNVNMAMYNWTNVAGRPVWNDTYTKVEILPANAPFVGGANRLDCANPMSCTYAEEIQNFANWFTYYRLREYAAKAALGRSISDVSRLRLGYTVLNDAANDSLNIDLMNASFRSGNKLAMMDQIYSVNSGGGTPLRTALERAGKHFECKEDDSFGSGADSNPGDAGCPVLAAPQGQCQVNYTLLFSDGEWNGSDPDEDGNHDNDDSDSTSAFDEGMYEDAFETSLADVAMYYYERDLHSTLDNDVPTSVYDTRAAPASAFGADDKTMHQHMKTYTVGFGLNTGTTPPDPSDYTTAFVWPDPTTTISAKADDLMHAAINGRGQYLEANDPVALASALQTAFNVFTDGSISVSAVAFSTTVLRNDTVEYRGFFNPKFNSGDLVAFDVNAATGVVDVDNPVWRAAEEMNSVNFSTRLVATLDGITDTAIPFKFASLNVNQLAGIQENEVNFLRGERVNEEPAGLLRQRQPIDGLIGDIVHSAPIYVGAPRARHRDQEPFPQGTDLYSDYFNSKSSRAGMVYVGANDGMLHAFSADTGDEAFAYIPNKFLDTTQNYANALDELSSVTYSHKFFTDLTPSIEDVFMPESKLSATRSWNTVLVSGLGAGGKGLYALNVNSPSTSYSSEVNALKTVLWEFTDADDTYPVDDLGVPLGGGAWVDGFGLPVKDLGYTFSQPQLVMSNAIIGGDNAWVALFGNGYNSTAGIAKLFVLSLEEGLDGWSAADFLKLDTGEGVKASPDTLAGLPNGLGTPAVIDEDLNGTVDLAYAGDLFGNLYRFDLRDEDPDNWVTTKLFQATYTSGGTTTRQPITAQPFVRKHPYQEGFIVIFGTGSYVTEDDATSTAIQSVYGIWDRGGELNPPTAQSNTKADRLVEQVLTNSYDETVTPFSRLRYITDNAVDYVADDASGTAGTYGWYIDFDLVRPVLTRQGNANPDITGNTPPAIQYPGERAVRRIVSRGDEILITTLVPRDANSCLIAPPGSIFPVSSVTGGDPGRAIFDFNNDGVVDDDDLVDGHSAGIVLDADMLNGTLVDPSLLLGEGDTDFLFLSGGNEQISVRVAKNVANKTGRLSWRELDNAN